MSKYTVNLTYTLNEDVEIDAESQEDAEKIVVGMAESRMDAYSRKGCSSVCYMFSDYGGEYVCGQVDRIQ